MKVGLISDTHDHLGNVEIAMGIFARRGVEMVVHAGDWVAPFTARKFQSFGAPLVGAFGNNDGEIVGLSRAFKEMGASVRGEMTEFELEGTRAAVIHGTYPTLVEALAQSKLFPIVITGHTHQSVVERRNGVLLVNPGEACGYLHGRSTVGILDTEKPDAEILDLQ